MNLEEKFVPIGIAHTDYKEWYNVFSIIYKREEIARIDGIKIRIFPGEDRGKHNYPHLHAVYSGENVVVRIDNGEIIEGNIPKNKMKLVTLWVNEHKDLIRNKWNELNDGIKLPVI